MSDNIYSKLDANAREIRIMVLQPGDWEDGIDCKIIAVSLDSKPDYEALSYAWGDPSFKHQVTFNNTPGAVNANLYTALHRLRSPHHPRTVWVDALCINQKDTKEKNQQVALMGEIYRCCSRVLIWLGDVERPVALPMITWYGNDRDTKMIEDYLQDESGQPPLMHSQFSVDMADVQGAIVFISLISRHLHLFDWPFFRHVEGSLPEPTSRWDQVLRGLRLLVKAPWWDRMWVVQETILPPNAIIQFGNCLLPWSVVSEARIRLKHHYQFCCSGNLEALSATEDRLLMDFEAKVNDMQLLRDRFARGDALSLPGLMDLTSRRLATDDRDRVFALLAVVTDWGEREPIRADYELNIVQVFSKVVIETIKASGSLLILQGTPITNPPELPSFVTEFSTGYWRSVQFDRIIASKLFRATLGVPYDVRMFKVLHNSKLALAILGLGDNDEVVATADHIWGASLNTSSDLTKVETLCSWEQFADIDKNPDRLYPNGKSWKEVFWRCITNDVLNKSLVNESITGADQEVPGTWRRLNEQDYEVYEAWWLHAQAAAASPLGVSHVYGGIRLPGREAWDHVPEYKRTRYDQAIQAATVRRRPFITKGGYLGLGPIATSPGDKVVLLLGGDVPFLLRECGSLRKSTPINEPVIPLWSFVGDCYVHGLMDGEAIVDRWQEKKTTYWVI